MGENKKIIIGYIVIALFGATLIFKGVSTRNGLNHNTITLSEFFNKSSLKNNFVKDEVAYSTQTVYRIKHLINGVIRRRTDYFYVIFTEDMQHCISIRADKKWGEGFDKKTGKALKESKISGKTKETDDDVKSYLEEEIKIQEGAENLIVDYYIDCMALEDSIYYIICGVGIILLFGAAETSYILSSYNNEVLEKILMIVFVIGLTATIVGGIKIL